MLSMLKKRRGSSRCRQCNVEGPSGPSLKRRKSMNERDRLQYIKVLLALDGHSDGDLVETIDRAIDNLDNEKPCGTGCGTSLANVENRTF